LFESDQEERQHPGSAMTTAAAPSPLA
jgi:hypothetical protein